MRNTIVTERKNGHPGFQEYSQRVPFMFINVEGILAKFEGIFLKYSVLEGKATINSSPIIIDHLSSRPHLLQPHQIRGELFPVYSGFSRQNVVDTNVEHQISVFQVFLRTTIKKSIHFRIV